MGIVLGFSPGVITGWEERTLIGLTPGGTPSASPRNSSYVRARVQLKLMSSKIWESGVK